MECHVSGCDAGRGRQIALYRGLTLVELLVATAAVSAVAAISLPAVSTLREASRQVSCASRISRITKGLASYDVTRGELPGWRNVLDPYTASRCRDKPGNQSSTGWSDACVSWSVMVLPFIDEQELFDWYGDYSPTRTTDDVRVKRVELYTCPAVERDLSSRSPLCYSVNGGSGADSVDAQGRQYTGDGVFVDAAGNVRSQPWYVTAGGAKEYLPARSNLAAVAEGDGTSHTIMLAERTGPSSPRDVSWTDNPSPAAMSPNAVQTTHAILHPGGIHPGYGQPGGGESIHATMNTWMKIRGDHGIRYPSSRHEGGFLSTFCDGHVRFVSNSIDQWVYCQMLTSDPRQASFRVSMFEKVAGPDGSLNRYVFRESDLDGTRDR